MESRIQIFNLILGTADEQVHKTPEQLEAEKKEEEHAARTI